MPLSTSQWAMVSAAVAVAASVYWLRSRRDPRDAPPLAADTAEEASGASVPSGAATVSPSLEPDAKAAVEAALDRADPVQQQLMAEHLILVDADDRVIGHGSKKDSHIMKNIEAGMLHRAFSVFLLDPSGRLLLQKRSEEKITFPLYWANTCCSHPLATPEEMETKDHLGVIRAARRKMEQELGIDPAQVPEDSFTFLTRVHYQASSDDVWGEHEVDHILICRPPAAVTLNVNANEVANVAWVSLEQIDEWVANARATGEKLSPWFQLITTHLLPKWWRAALEDRLAPLVDEHTIHHY